MTTELFVVKQRVPSAIAVRSATSSSSSREFLPELSQGESARVAVSPGEDAHVALRKRPLSLATSWRAADGNWIHRSSSAPYEIQMRQDRQRLPKVLLTRVGAWRPSNAAGKGAAPATVPEFNAMKHYHPEHGPEEELDKRLLKIKEIFATPPKVKEWKLSPRLEEMSKPRMVKVPAGLAFRGSAPPPEALVKKKRRANHIPMSPKERLAANRSGSAPDLGHSNSDPFADLDNQLNKILRSGTPKSSQSSKPSSAKAKAKASTPVANQKTPTSKTAGKLPAARANSSDMQSANGQSGDLSKFVEDLPESGDSKRQEFNSYNSAPRQVGIASQSYDEDTVEDSPAAGPVDRIDSGTYSADEFASFSAPLNESDEFYSDEEMESSKE